MLLDIVDAFGRTLRPTQVTVTDQAGRDFSPAAFAGLLPSLPYGTYKLRVLVTGFLYWDGMLRIQQPRLRMTVGMQLGSIDGPKPYCSVSGRVTDLDNKNTTAVWLRLLPIFGNGIFEAEVDKSGEFRRDRVECGKYVLVIAAS